VVNARTQRGSAATINGLAVAAALVLVACSRSAAPDRGNDAARSPASVAFADPIALTAGRDPEALALADLDGDGSIDIVTANSYGDDISTFLGHGDGTFGAATDFPVGRAPASILAVDLNGDGHVDVATTNGGLAHGEEEEIPGSGDITVLLGRGNGAMKTATDYAAGDVPMGLAVADLDGDGAVELVTVDRHASRLIVLFGDGKGAFPTEARVSIPDLMLSRRLSIDDVNGDGIADVLVPDEGTGRVWVLVGRGDARFEAPASYPTDGIEAVAVTTGDPNGDGRLDMATANGFPAHDVSVLLGTGKGVFGDPRTFGTGYAPHSIVAIDVNGDGNLDLVTGDVGDSTATVLLGVGDGTFKDGVALAVGKRRRQQHDLRGRRERRWHAGHRHGELQAVEPRDRSPPDFRLASRSRHSPERSRPIAGDGPVDFSGEAS
jgi:hypothetical protein